MPRKKIFLFILIQVLFCSSVWSQERTITGNIQDRDGKPLENVTIKSKLSDRGSSSSTLGKFSLSVLANDTLVVSAIGYEMKKIVLDGATNYLIVLERIDQQLNDVVVIGYGTQRKVNLTGAVSVADSRTFESRPVQNAAQMLQGVVPGLSISQGGGSLEDRPSINIRGVGTIGQGSNASPLILIDGMEGDINALNPQDIESVSVLKDAASSSIYGTRAPFGVILITTKKGSKGKSTINYSNNIRSSSPVLLPKMMNSLDFATYFNEASINGGGGLIYSPERIQRIKDFMDGTLKESVIKDPANPSQWHEGYYGGNDNVDWYRALFRARATSHEHNLSISGGNSNLQYYVSGQYLHQNGLMVFNQDFYKRYSLTGRVNANVNSYTKLEYSVRFSREDFERPSRLTNNLFGDLARQGWPTLPLYDPNGFLFSSPSPALGLKDGGRDVHQNDQLYQQIHLIVEPIKNFQLHAMVNYRSRNNFRHWDILTTYNHDVNGIPYAYDKDNHVHEYAFRENYNNNSFYVDYSRVIGNSHSIKILGGMQSEYSKYRQFNAQRNGIIVPELPVLDLTTGSNFNGEPVVPTVAGQYQNWTTAGYFGRINYDYDGRYLVEFNLRYDGTSRFRSDKRWFYSPSVSAGWNIAMEKFWNPLYDVINVFKLRGSYGKLGNQNTNNWYPTYVTMPVGTNNGGWLINGVRPNTANAPGLVSRSLTWESIRSWNIGLDMAFMNGKITASFDYFTRFTDNMVGPAPELPAILGTGVPSTNNTDLKTYGFEFDLSWRGKVRSDIDLDARFTFSDAQTTILSYPQNFTGSIDQYRSNQKLGEIWGYETKGIAKSQEEMDAHLNSLPNGGQSALGSQFSAGDIMYRDINGDGKIDAGGRLISNSGDLKVIGNNTPRYLVGLNMGASWKGFDFRFFLQGVLKRDYFQDSYYFWGASRGSVWWSSGLEEHKDYFRADPEHKMGQNLDSYYPRPLFDWAANKNQQYQTRYLQNAAYLRLKNIQIGYSIPAALTNKIGISKLRLYISGENLFTITKMTSIFDPETIGGGWGGNVYPLSKVVSAGLNVNF